MFESVVKYMNDAKAVNGHKRTYKPEVPEWLATIN
jgi:hypothetical protein